MTSYFPSNFLKMYLFLFGLAWDVPKSLLFELFQFISIIKLFFGEKKWNLASPPADEGTSHHFLLFGPINISSQWKTLTRQTQRVWCSRMF